MIGLGTTGGWRHADLTLAREFARRGIEVEGCWPVVPRLRRLRELARPLSSEYIEAFAMRRALLRHVSSGHDLLVVSSNTGALLLPRRWSNRTMVWSDTPISSRPKRAGRAIPGPRRASGDIQGGFDRRPTAAFGRALPRALP